MNRMEGGDTGVLTSLRFYDEERKKARDVVRFEGSNVDHFTTSDGGDISLCHLSTVLPFTQGNFNPIQNVHEDLAAIALAAHHLNTGDGRIVEQVEGLNERCKVRFTTEFSDTQHNAGVTLNHVVLQSNREPNSPERIPCAFIGASRSSVSIPTSIVTGLLGYPQVSGSSTSVNLDDKSQFPLFGRTIPSDQGNAVPIIIYMSSVLNIKHLSVINVNDAYGNAFVEGLRIAAEIHAPGMKIHQVPLDEGQIEGAIQSIKQVQYRFVFCIIFTIELHDALLAEAFRQGVAGDGLHNWLFADSFAGEIDGRVYPQDSPLHKAYRGVGLLEASGGVPGIPSYDNFLAQFPPLRNPTDLQYLGSLFPTHDHPNYPDEIPFVNGEKFLTTPLVSSFAPFYYEAAISLGLAACAASAESESFTGREHFDQMLQMRVSGVAGTVLFDPTTGTRDPSSVLYKVTNFLPQDVDGGVAFVPVVTDLFQNSQWNSQKEYIFNDGTANIPADLPPPVENEPNLALMIVLPVCLSFFILVVGYFYLERAKRENDMVWKVKKEELKFTDPPVIIGRGTFGLVLQAEYRGTQVAVKRVIPQKGTEADDSANNNTQLEDDELGSSRKPSYAEDMSGGTDNPGMMSGMRSGQGGLGHQSGFVSGLASGFDWFKSGTGIENGTGLIGVVSRKNPASLRKKLREEFIEEMRYLSKLRHPCVTTVMGAVISKGEEPMLVMEYMDHGSLYDILHNETMVIEGELLLPLLRDVSQGVRFLHSADPQVIHGDLKAANILVDTRFRAKVADFGLSQKKNLGGTGTPFWMAPELLREESPNTAATDVFSFGIILYEVYSRRDPYEGEDPKEVLRLVADKDIRKRPPFPLRMPEKVKSLMSDCLEEEPEKRPTFEELDMRLKRVDAETADPGFAPSLKPSSLSLFDIFPRHVAEALRDGRTVEPEHKESVTIFFSDIVGFTNISSELEPRKVAAMLDRLYTSFDELSQKHDVFKVETIGDAYMAVTNLVKDQSTDHAKRIALFAIDALAAANAIFIDEDDPDRGVVNIRVGFHSGPVVADVVGTRNPRYCLFGDTVNTASRMESNSTVNRIHCSKAAAKLLHTQCPELSLKSRGKIPIKGKGEMHTFWVNEGMDRKSMLLRTLESNRGALGSDKSTAGRLETIIDILDESNRSTFSGEEGRSGEFRSSELYSSELLGAPESARRGPSAGTNKMEVLKEDNAAGSPSVHEKSTESLSPPVSEEEASTELAVHDPAVVVQHSISHWISASEKGAQAEDPPESAPQILTSGDMAILRDQ